MSRAVLLRGGNPEACYASTVPPSIQAAANATLYFQVMHSDIFRDDAKASS